MFDSHAHLTDSSFARDRQKVIKDAFNAGITGMLTIPGTQEEQEEFLNLLKSYDFIYGAAGVHPGELKGILSTGNTGEVLKYLDGFLGKNDKVVAVGEIGLDYYYPDSPPKEFQKEIFQLQLRFARKNNLPVIIHCRDAWQDMMDILEKDKPVSGVMHCFSGSMEVMTRCIDLGLYISVAGTVTFSNSRKMSELAGQIPLGKLLVETDCPYLAPQEMRGKRNEPAFLKYTINKVAQIRSVPVEEVIKVTSQNARTLFRIK